MVTMIYEYMYLYSGLGIGTMGGPNMTQNQLNQFGNQRNLHSTFGQGEIRKLVFWSILNHFTWWDVFSIV